MGDTVRIIEIYTEDLIDNVYSSLIYQPDEILFIFTTKKIPLKYWDLKRFLFKKLISCKINELIIDPNNKDQLEKFVASLDENDLIDLTGGSDYLKFLLTKFNSKSKYVVIDFNNNKYLYYDGNYQILNLDFKLGFEDYLTICGASIISCDSRKYKYEQNFIIELFSLVKRKKKDWLALVEFFNTVFTIENSSKHKIFVPKKKHVERYQDFYRILAKYQICLINKQGEYCFDYDFTKLEIIIKAGTILELYIYYLLKNYDKCFFVESGVKIKWDSDDQKDNTTNEIDVIAQVGSKVHFISCKLTKVVTSTINEVYVLADRFGLGYGQMSIVALNEITLGVKERASAIDCKIIDVTRLTDKEILRLLEV